MELKDKIVVITGGSEGLGKTLAQYFHNEGSKVIISSKNKEELEKSANEIGIDYFVADVTKEDEMEKLVEFALQKYNTLDVWVNNAGVLYSFLSEDKYIDVAKAKEMFDVNFFGTIFGSRQALKKMKSVNSGAIINIISTAALDATKAKNLKIYFASKWAVRAYTEALNEEYKNSGISIFAVYPGGIKTKLWRNYKHEKFDEFMALEYVADIIINNLKSDNPEHSLIIKRPTA
ncbi:MAG: SDR family NAD(P)-dependent oxidoreductase [Candidatus Nomurabacteria bacterium]|nr:SDR family NAD(P)-dependent oxidoreductase [Candidatus Nomurabacteria bacterium]